MDGAWAVSKGCIPRGSEEEGRGMPQAPPRRNRPDRRASHRTHKKRIEAKKNKTFWACAEEYIALHFTADGYKDPEKAAERMRRGLELYARSFIGSVPVKLIDTDLVIEILKPIWETKPVTAGKIRSWIEAVLGYAKVRGYRDGDNPAIFRDNLQRIMPKRSRKKRTEHHAGLHYDEIGGFMGQLRGQPGIAARALEFTILTAARTGEVIGARWREFNFRENTWTIPAERMKAGEEHIVPLSDDALSVLGEMRKAAEGEFVFPGQKVGEPLSNMAMEMTLRRMGRDDITVHGFRSTFRTWVEECTEFLPHLAEIALAHTVAAANLAGVDPSLWRAYQRGRLLDRRPPMMDQWAEFLATSKHEPREGDRRGHGTDVEDVRAAMEQVELGQKRALLNVASRDAIERLNLAGAEQAPADPVLPHLDMKQIVMKKPAFYECPACGFFHPEGGNCTVESRHDIEDLEGEFGEDGWVEIDPLVAASEPERVL
jgi:integrase